MKNKYAGMSVNERLYVSRLINEFDKAVEEQDLDRIRSILSNMELTEESIMPILERLVLKQ